MNTYSMILLAAGIGKRMKREIPKHFLPLGGKPIIVHTLERVDRIPQITEIVIVINSDRIDEMKELIHNRNLKKTYKIIPGGVSRQESVFIGLQAASQTHILIHEAARPFVKQADFQMLLDTPEDNVILGVPINFTVLEGGDKVESLLERHRLVNVQLPQKYNRDSLLQAHLTARKEKKNFTEDASLLFYYTQVPIKILRGSEYNIKITTPVDLIIGEQIYKDYILESET